MSINPIALKEILLQDFTRYLRWSFKTKYNSKVILTESHIKICKHLIQAYLGNIKKLVINMPPRSGKTEIVNTFIEWSITKHPKAKYIMTSYSDTLVANSSQQIRDIINSQEHKQLFNLETKKDTQSKKLWKTNENGGVYAVSSFGQITGHGAGLKSVDEWGGCIIVDDPLKPDDANSLLKLEKVKEWYETTLSNRVNNPNVPIIIIMQRLHTDDLVGCIEQNLFKDKDEWTFLKIQAMNEDTKVSFWEDYYPVSRLEQMKSSNKAYFYSQFQQDPIIKGGNLIKYDWFQWWTVLPELSHLIITVDTAQKTKEINDFTVMQCWAVAKNKDLYLLDMIRGKFEAPQLRQTAKTFYHKWDNYKRDERVIRLRKMHIEDKSSGSSLIQDLRQDKLKIGDIQRNTDKVSRVMDFSPHIEAQQVYLNESVKDVQELISECLAFPNGKHDDTIDPMMDAIELTQLKARGLTASMFD